MSEHKINKQHSNHDVILKICNEKHLSNSFKAYKPQNFTSLINNPKVSKLSVIYSSIIFNILVFVYW